MALGSVIRLVPQWRYVLVKQIDEKSEAGSCARENVSDSLFVGQPVGLCFASSSKVSKSVIESPSSENIYSYVCQKIVLQDSHLQK